MLCAWCEKPLPPGRRRDARTCGKPCRQAAHRFGRAVAQGLGVDGRRVAGADGLEVRRVAAAGAGAGRRVAASSSCSARHVAEDLGGRRRRVAPAAPSSARRFGYADPPYPGLAWRYYRSPEVDHVELVARLVRDFPDGWALSTSSSALRWVLALCPADARVCPWVRGSRRVRAHRPLNAWEPLIVWGGREVVEPVDDVLTLAIASRPRSHPDALVGMKPPKFVAWLWRLWGARPGDELADLYPGSRAVSHAWRKLSQLEREYSGDGSRAAS